MEKKSFLDIASMTENHTFMKNYDNAYDYVKIGNKYYATKKNEDKWFDISGNLEATNKLDQYLSNGGDKEHKLQQKVTVNKDRIAQERLRKQREEELRKQREDNKKRHNEAIKSRQKSNKAENRLEVTGVVKKQNNNIPNAAEYVKRKSLSITPRYAILNTPIPYPDWGQNEIVQNTKTIKQFNINYQNKTTNNPSKKIAEARAAYNKKDIAELNKRFYKNK